MPFNYRSTNTIGYTHFGGALVVGTELGSGIELNPNSSGSAANIMPAGDETNKSIALVGKGTGTVALGNSSSPVILSSGSVLQVGSTAPFAGWIRQNSSVATPNFNSTDNITIVSTVTVVGANSSHYVLVNPQNVSTSVLISGRAGSTAGSINLIWTKISTVTIAASTAHVRMLVFRF